ncbi:hydantoinase B/oxoprolinase family protein [Microbaculum marinum]|uniref:Hydantoinase B/oxoprolinase family protein n=1 Tax=Microbaculum marinum TaxID=1764581 RepID=A0AAW9RDQ9_9HYPH
MNEHRVDASPHAALKHDPVTTEIVRNGLIAATEEMKQNLMRTAYNMIIYEALDFTVGVFDRDGNVLSIGIGLPMFIRGISETIKAKIAHFGIDGIHPGDVLLTNDAYITGSHLNHMTFTVPVFHDDEIVGFAGCMAHWQDVGGTLDGMTTDIYSEGLQMPIVKMYRRGEINQDIVDIIEMNVRLPERAMGDMRAQIAAVRSGERHMTNLFRKHGRDRVLGAIAAIMDHSEALVRERVRAIPDGTYEAESFMDDDGVDLGRRVPIRVKVIVAGDRMTIDLTDVSKQVRGFYNSGTTAGLSCCQVAFKCLTSALDFPLNDGSFRPLDIILPPGRVVSAQKPAPMRWWMTFPMTIVDTVFKALQPAIPDKVIAAHHADLVVALVNGYQPKDGKLFIYTGGLIGGGWGAKSSEDGVCTTIAINDGDTHNGPSEQVEVKYPLLVERYGLYEDSGGPGTFRGGLGAVYTVRARGDIMLNAQIERVISRPWGLAGGLSGAGNQVTVQHAGGDEDYFPSGKVLSRRIRGGDSFTLRSGGGGGYGSPLDRDPSRVEDDVIHGYVSREKAETVYGVVFSEDGETIDLEATASRRAELRDAGRPTDEDGMTLYGQKAQEAAEKAAAQQAARQRHDHDHHHHGHSHDLIRDKDDYELRLQLALARRCC